jgi:hypothetical protein
VTQLLDLDSLVAAKVRDELDAMNGRVEQLVAQAVDRELARVVHDLVGAELETRASAHATSAGPSAEGPAKDDDTRAVDPSLLRTCRLCGTAKLPAEFDRHRLVCRACRRDQDRERIARRARTADDDTETPRTDDAS